MATGYPSPGGQASSAFSWRWSKPGTRVAATTRRGRLVQAKSLSFIDRGARQARRTFKLEPSDLTVWHSLFFLLTIGVPALAGPLVHDPGAGIAGAVAGLMFSLSDSEDPLPRRLFLLFRTTVMLLTCGTLGAVIGGYHGSFWLAFAALTFATGWMSLRASTWTAAFRNGSLALVAMAGAGGATWMTGGLVLLAAVLNVFTRYAGDRWFPDGPRRVLPALPDPEVPGGAAAVRFCLIYAATVALGLWIGELRGLSHPMWIATTVLLVMQPHAGVSYRRCVQRAFGTLAGVLGALIVVEAFHTVWLLAATTLLLALVLPHGSTRNYWVHSALVACLLMVLYDFAGAGHGVDAMLLTERVKDVLIGCALGLVATTFALTPHVRPRENQSDPNL